MGTEQDDWLWGIWFDIFSFSHKKNWASQVAQCVKNPPAMQETWFLSLSWEDPLEEGMATHSSILVWKIS